MCEGGLNPRTLLVEGVRAQRWLREELERRGRLCLCQAFNAPILLAGGRAGLFLHLPAALVQVSQAACWCHNLEWVQPAGSSGVCLCPGRTGSAP